MELNNISFINGVRSEPINENFNIIKDEFQQERISVAGSGIVSGFEVASLGQNESKQHNLMVSTGTLITRTGSRVEVEGMQIQLPLIESYENRIIEIISSSDIFIELEQPPFSKDHQGYWTSQRFRDHDNQEDVPVVRHFDISRQRAGEPVEITDIIGRRIELTLDAENLQHESYQATYSVSDRKIHAITVNDSGEFHVRQGINSTSPSTVDLSDYPDEYVLALVEMVPGIETQVIIYQQLQKHRNLLTDKNGNLLIGGHYFSDLYYRMFFLEEPSIEDRRENTIWFDKADNLLKVWQRADGQYRWVTISDTEQSFRREIKSWKPEDNVPEEDGEDVLSYKTYLLNLDEEGPNEDEPYFYTPDVKSVEVIVDNVLLMDDQFEEVVGTYKGRERGIGIRLKEAIDKPAYVEMRVNQIVKKAQSGVSHIFERAATFVHEGSFVYNEQAHFETEVPYVGDDHQLEVFLNGKKLVNGLQFEEIRLENDVALPAPKGDLSRHFKIAEALSLDNGDIINYRITKSFFSYDHFNLFLKELEESFEQERLTIEETQQQVNTVETDLQNTQVTFNNLISSLQAQIDQQEQRIEHLEDHAVIAGDPTSITKIPQELKDRVYRDTKTFIHHMNTGIKVLENVSPTDAFIVSYREIGSQESWMLEQGAGKSYEVTTHASGARMSFHPELISEDHEALISVIAFGFED